MKHWKLKDLFSGTLMICLYQVLHCYQDTQDRTAFCNHKIVEYIR